MFGTQFYNFCISTICVRTKHGSSHRGNGNFKIENEYFFFLNTPKREIKKLYGLKRRVASVLHRTSTPGDWRVTVLRSGKKVADVGGLRRKRRPRRRRCAPEKTVLTNKNARAAAVRTKQGKSLKYTEISVRQSRPSRPHPIRGTFLRPPPAARLGVGSVDTVSNALAVHL